MFYKYVIDDAAQGVTKSDKEILIKDFVQIDKEEYDQLAEEFGVKEPLPTLTPEEILTAKIEALSDRNEFLEDCIAEMAQIIYSE